MESRKFLNDPRYLWISELGRLIYLMCMCVFTYRVPYPLQSQQERKPRTFNVTLTKAVCDLEVIKDHLNKPVVMAPEFLYRMELEDYVWLGGQRTSPEIVIK